MGLTGTIGYKTLQNIVTTTAQDLSDFGFTATDLKYADRMLISVVTNEILVNYTDVAPNVGGFGHVIPAGVSFLPLWPNENILNFQMIIPTGGSDATVTITLETSDPRGYARDSA